MSWTSLVLFAAIAPVATAAARPFTVEKITDEVSVVHGPVNGVLIQRPGETLAIYGDPRPEPAMARQVLFTHYRRDVVWAGRRLVESEYSWSSAAERFDSILRRVVTSPAQPLACR